LTAAAPKAPERKSTWDCSCEAICSNLGRVSRERREEVVDSPVSNPVGETSGLEGGGVELGQGTSVEVVLEVLKGHYET
jgi:hypothetical protein